MGRTVVFGDLAAAQAAFALGPVRFRCQVCSRAHWSVSRAPRRCLGVLRYALDDRVAEESALCAAVRQLDKEFPALALCAEWKWPPFFVDGDDDGEWKEFTSLRRVLLGGFWSESLCTLFDIAALAVPRAAMAAFCTAWREAKTAEFQARAREFDRAHTEDYRRLRLLAERLCVPRSFPPVVSLRYKDKTGCLETVAFARDGERVVPYLAFLVAEFCLPALSRTYDRAFGAGKGLAQVHAQGYALTAIGTDPARLHAVVCMGTALPRRASSKTAFLLRWSVGERLPAVVGIVPDACAGSLPEALAHAKPLPSGGGSG